MAAGREKVSACTNNRMKADPVIKVCGIQSLPEAFNSIAAGANTLGFLMGLTHKAEDRIDEGKAAFIIARLPASVRTVMVTHLFDADKIIDIAQKTGVSAIQVHDDLPIEGMTKLRQQLPKIELIKAVHVTGPEAVEKAKLYEAHADFLLLDSRTADRLGGTGMTHDWNLSRKIVHMSSIPVVLAGGLTPENVATAIQTVRPAGIDANSGLEDTHGIKDPAKVSAFAAQGRALLARPEVSKRSSSVD